MGPGGVMCFGQVELRVKAESQAMTQSVRLSCLFGSYLPLRYRFTTLLSTSSELLGVILGKTCERGTLQLSPDLGKAGLWCINSLCCPTQMNVCVTEALLRLALPVPKLGGPPSSPPCLPALLPGHLPKTHVESCTSLNFCSHRAMLHWKIPNKPRNNYLETILNIA